MVRSYLRLVFKLSTTEFICNLSMIFATNDTNHSTNELTNGSVLNTTFLTPAIINMISFLMFTCCVIVC